MRKHRINRCFIIFFVKHYLYLKTSSNFEFQNKNHAKTTHRMRTKH